MTEQDQLCPAGRVGRSAVPHPALVWAGRMAWSVAVVTLAASTTRQAVSHPAGPALTQHSKHAAELLTLASRNIIATLIRLLSVVLFQIHFYYTKLFRGHPWLAVGCVTWSSGTGRLSGWNV